MFPTVTILMYCVDVLILVGQRWCRWCNNVCRVTGGFSNGWRGTACGGEALGTSGLPFYLNSLGFFMGIYGLKETTWWRPPIWKPTYLGTVTPSGRPISTQTVARIRTHALGDPKASRAQRFHCTTPVGVKENVWIPARDKKGNIASRCLSS